IDPEQQNPDLLELLAGIQWIQDLLGNDEHELDAAFRDPLDSTVYFFRRGTCLRYDADTKKPLTPPVSSIKDDWPGLWGDGDFNTVSLAQLQMAFEAARHDYLVTPVPLPDYRLQMQVVPEVSGLRAAGKDLFVLALVGSKLHIRIFDSDGNRAVYWAEGDADSVDAMNAAKQLFAVIPPRALL